MAMSRVGLVSALLAVGCAPSRAAHPPPVQEWARPLTAYIEAGMAAMGELPFDQSILDLEVHRGCLHLGYGDGGANT